MNGEVEFESKESTIRRHSHSMAPPIVYKLESLASMLQTEAWQQRLKFKNVIDGSTPGKKEYLENGFRIWGIIDSEGHHAVAFAPEKLLPDISDATYSFMDSTYKTIPFIRRAYQLLVFVTEVKGKVSNHYIRNN